MNDCEEGRFSELQTNMLSKPTVPEPPKYLIMRQRDSYPTNLMIPTIVTYT